MSVLGYLCDEVGENPDHLKYEEYLERQTEYIEKVELSMCPVINSGRGESGGTSLTVVLSVVIFIVAYLSDSFRNEDDNLLHFQ